MLELSAGEELGGYRIEGVAGRGGMGVVYRAMDLRLQRAVAIKVIAPHLTGDPQFRVRFERESRLAAGIRHPNVITIYYAGEHNGQLFVVMEYVDGTDLGAAIAAEGRLDPRRATNIVSEVAGALDAAHAQNLVHRDVKPANVLLAPGAQSDSVFLTDFGLTKHAASDSRVTATGMFVGTLDYMAPEQVSGPTVDARTDVYSLGCVLFHALTGQVPYPRGNPLATLFAHANEPPPEVRAAAPEIPEELESVVKVAMAKDPADRFASAGELGRAAVSAVMDPGGRRGDGVDAALATTRIRQHEPPPPPDRWPPPKPADAAPRQPFTRIDLPAHAEALCTAAGCVWAALPDEDAVVRVHADTHALVGGPIEVGSEPIALAGRNDLVLVANQHDGTLTRIDPIAGVVLSQEISLWTGPLRLLRRNALEPEYVSPATSRVPVRELLTPDTAIAFDGVAAWVAIPQLDEVMRIESVHGQVIRSPVAVGRMPLALAIADQVVWAANYADDTVSMIDVHTHREIAEVRVPRGPMALVSASAYVWVLSADASCITRIRSESGQVVGEPIRVSAGVDVIAAHGDDIWLLDRHEAVLTRLAARSGAVAGWTRIEGRPATLAAGDGTVWIALEDEPALLRFSG
jgi:YVTN family beta-propeller protein